LSHKIGQSETRRFVLFVGGGLNWTFKQMTLHKRVTATRNVCI